MARKRSILAALTGFFICTEVFEVSNLLDLIAQYEDGQRKIDQAIAINRARAAAEPNRRRRLDLDRQHQVLLTMRADLAYGINSMRRCLPDAGLGK